MTSLINLTDNPCPKRRKNKNALTSLLQYSFITPNQPPKRRIDNTDLKNVMVRNWVVN